MGEYKVAVRHGDDGSVEMTIRTAVSEAVVLLSPSEARQLINMLERVADGEVAL